MKRVVREKTTRAYLSADGKWVTDFHLAEDFPNTESAMSAVWNFEGKDVLELVLVLGQNPSEEYDVALPIFPPPSP